MIVLPDEREPVAQLLGFLEYGERLAQDCAAAQAAFVADPGHCRFLLNQAKQESLHATVFRGVIAWLAPRRLGATPLLPPLERYRALVEDAVKRRDLHESLMAEQLILEGLGEAILNRIEAGLVKRGAPFGRLRRILLLQEEAHHGFGRRLLDRARGDGTLQPDRLRGRAEEYLGLTQDMVLMLASLFSTIDEDASAWASDVRLYVPDWCVG
ncbi:MAG TPA: hypothetical protein VLA99_09975 [Nitrospiraceae bacterium]|nr:hypothetical protein [Nitrospiraceae bacterium]